MSTEIYSKVIYQSEFKQIRMTISEFKDVEYIHFREYFQDFDEDQKTTNKGIYIHLDIESSKEVFRGISEVLSLAENKEVIEEYFSEIIREAYTK